MLLMVMVTSQSSNGRKRTNDTGTVVFVLILLKTTISPASVAGENGCTWNEETCRFAAKQAICGV
jgi:hypothetical protein